MHFHLLRLVLSCMVLCRLPSVSCRYDGQAVLIRITVVVDVVSATSCAVLVGPAPKFLAGQPLLSATTECLATDDARQLLVFFVTHVVFCDALHSPFPRLLNSTSRRTRWSSNTRTSLQRLLHHSCCLLRCASLSISSTS